jgi:hypothetical protein
VSVVKCSANGMNGFKCDDPGALCHTYAEGDTRAMATARIRAEMDGNVYSAQKDRQLQGQQTGMGKGKAAGRMDGGTRQKMNSGSVGAKRGATGGADYNQSTAGSIDRSG